jgi:excisionase family DNA binding protein
MSSAQSSPPERLLTVQDAADRMSTSVRFVRRLIAERRIAYVKLGRHVRITEADIAAFIKAGRVQPLEASGIWRQRREVA